MELIYTLIISGAIAAVIAVIISKGFRHFAEVKYGGINDLARMKKELEKVAKDMEKIERDDLRSRVQYLENKDGVGVFR